MPYKLKYTDRKATCTECKARVGPYAWMVIQERDDEAPDEDQTGWRIRRFCLGCGESKMAKDASLLAQRLAEVGNIRALMAAIPRSKVRRKVPDKAEFFKCPSCKKTKATRILADQRVLGEDKKIKCLILCGNCGTAWVE